MATKALPLSEEMQNTFYSQGNRNAKSTGASLNLPWTGVFRVVVNIRVMYCFSLLELLVVLLRQHKN